MENNILKHQPLRMCVVCKERKTKDLLLRFFFDSDKKLNISTNFGKGIYFCRKQECINKLFSIKSLKKTYFDAMTKETSDKLIEYLESLKNM